MIHYSVPYIDKEEEAAVACAVSDGCINGEGRICKAAEAKLVSIMGARHVYLTTSGTHALELALMALDIKKGDEVICPSFTFVSTANAILRQGATPVFAEIEEDTLNIDIDDAMEKVTKRTRAIIPVHYGGFSCDMTRLVKEASRKGIHVVEDAAQAIGAEFDGKALGTFGELGCLSFHSTKNITCGEGGAAVVNRGGGLAGAIQVKREKGTNRFLFLEHKIAKYTWIDIGSSFVVSDVLAAMLLAQLNKLEEITDRRRAICEIYNSAFSPFAKNGCVSLCAPDRRSRGNGHIFWMLLDKRYSRREFLECMKGRDIECTHHYVPLHSSPFGTKVLGYKKTDLPLTEDVSARLVRLPVYASLADRDADRVIDAATELLRKGAQCRKK
jgi:dTDP-4-amino-4,6-dideoxygalactose transaminase